MSDQNAAATQATGATIGPATTSPAPIALADAPVAKLEPAQRAGWANVTFVTILPLYIIVIAVCLIALPKGITTSLFGPHPAATQPAIGPVTGQTPAPAVPSTTTSPDARTVSDVAKMAIDSSKDRADAMKDTYDKLFSLFAALGALLAFLGFKGMDTFMAAKRRSEEIVQTANSAVDRANAAYDRAVQAKKDHDEFVKVRYAADNSAEINTAHGIIMREIAELYKVLVHLNDAQKDVSKDANYRSYLDASRRYLDLVTDRPEGLGAKVIARAFVTKGNVLRRQGDYLGALKMVELVLDKYDPREESALFNAACYCCLIAQDEERLSNHTRSREYRQRSLAFLKRAIDAHPHLREDALDDQDFEWFRSKPEPRFGELTK